MKRVILRMLMKNAPHFMDIITTESEAQRVMTKWREGAKNGCLNGYDQAQDRYWVMVESEISSMFTIDYMKIEEEQRRQQVQQRGRPSEVPSYPPHHGWTGPGSSN